VRWGEADSRWSDRTLGYALVSLDAPFAQLRVLLALAAAAARCEGGAAFCDYIVAHRRLCRPDGTVILIREDPGLVDTNFFLFLFRTT
jgi:hypothetical protein